MIVLVTGANGLIGANLVRELIKQNYRVRAFVRETSDLRSLEGLDVEVAFGDILDKESIAKALKGCRLLFHTASIFSYSPAESERLITTAKIGTINVIEAAKEAKVKRVILTSSSVIFGSTARPAPINEAALHKEKEPVPYIDSKIIQYEIGSARAKELGVDTVFVCPTICVGPHDYGLSESNAIIINYLKDPFKVTWPGGCNIVSAGDVAKGHILAAKKGAPSEPYLLGAQNLKWRSIHETISAMCGVNGPLITANHTSSYLAASFSELLSIFTQKSPAVTRDQAKMVGQYYWYSHEKASLFGYKPSSAKNALAKAISWLIKSDHVPASIRNTMTVSSDIYEQRKNE